MKTFIVFLFLLLIPVSGFAQEGEDVKGSLPDIASGVIDYINTPRVLKTKVQQLEKRLDDQHRFYGEILATQRHVTGSIIHLLMGVVGILTALLAVNGYAFLKLMRAKGK